MISITLDISNRGGQHYYTFPSLYVQTDTSVKITYTWLVYRPLQIFP